MPWLLMLHIAALLCWVGALLYMPALTYSFATHRNRLQREVEEEHRMTSMPRMVFTVIATPAALLTIAAGTAVFLVHGTIALWLLVKLNFVVMLVICHTLAGVLIWRAETGKQRHLGVYSAALAATTVMIIIAILWLVLAKPWR